MNIQTPVYNNICQMIVRVLQHNVIIIYEAKIFITVNQQKSVTHKLPKEYEKRHCFQKYVINNSKNYFTNIFRLSQVFFCNLKNQILQKRADIYVDQIESHNQGFFVYLHI